MLANLVIDGDSLLTMLVNSHYRKEFFHSRSAANAATAATGSAWLNFPVSRNV
jgi:hypothetical protein